MTESEKMRPCVDCRWCWVGPGGVENARCQHPNNYKHNNFNLVTGEPNPKYIGPEFCGAQRHSTRHVDCGFAGEWWEQKARIMTGLPPDDLDRAETDAKTLYVKAWNVAHLPDNLWKIARHEALAAAKLILDRDQVTQREIK